VTVVFFSILFLSQGDAGSSADGIKVSAHVDTDRRASRNFCPPTFSPRSLLKETGAKFDVGKVHRLFECLMWAYLDRRVPTAALRKMIGDTRTTACSDAESSRCIWVNTCARKHAKLPPLSAISQHFFGRPHFRAVLYGVLHESRLLEFSDDPGANAEVGLRRAAELGLQAPFTAARFRQQPLIIMCYLFRCAKVLAELDPPRPPAAITGTVLTSMLASIEVKKKEVAAATERVRVLSRSVRSIASELRGMRRPKSHLARTLPRAGDGDEAGGRPRPASSLAATIGENRVTWDIPGGGGQGGLEAPQEEAAPEGDT